MRRMMMMVMIVVMGVLAMTTVVARAHPSAPARRGSAARRAGAGWSGMWAVRGALRGTGLMRVRRALLCARLWH